MEHKGTRSQRRDAGSNRYTYTVLVVLAVMAIPFLVSQFAISGSTPGLGNSKATLAARLAAMLDEEELGNLVANVEKKLASALRSPP